MIKVKKKILVGGGAGYIGSALVPALVREGYDVEVIDLLWFGNFLPKTIKVTKKDLFDCTEGDFANFDEFIFLAGLSNDPMAEYSPSKNFIMNGALPSYLAYLAKRAGVKRFIYASSCSVYGHTVGKIFNEGMTVSSAYPYGISKLQGEKGVLQLQDSKFSVIVLRQGTVCGYSPKMRMDLIINAMIKSALTDRKIIVNNPNIWRPIYDIRDCIHAFLLALNAPLRLNGVFNIAAGNFTVLQVAKAVQHTLKILGEDHIDLEIKNLPDKRNYKVSIKKARTQLKFQPKYFLSDIVKSIYEYKDVLGDLNQDCYYNIRIFKEIAQKEEVYRQKMAQIDQFKY